MAWRKHALLEDLIIIVSKLPWQVDLAQTLVACHFFHHYEHRPTGVFV